MRPLASVTSRDQATKLLTASVSWSELMRVQTYSAEQQHGRCSTLNQWLNQAALNCRERSMAAMSDAEVAIEPVRGHPNAFHFRFATHDGEITGRVSVAIEG